MSNRDRSREGATRAPALPHRGDRRHALIAIHVLRGRLVESNARTERLLQHEEALNAAVRQLVLLSEPPQITALGAQLAMGIASPPGSEILRSSYFRIEDGMVIVDAQFDDAGDGVEGSWPVTSTPACARP